VPATRARFDEQTGIHRVSVAWSLDPTDATPRRIRVSFVDLIDGYSTAADITNILAIAKLGSRDLAHLIKIHDAKIMPNHAVSGK
jgi:hypothetical protein